ncbi:MAG: selenocysteine-specific translation elongation factor [Fidelibacterota bacterium]
MPQIVIGTAGHIDHGKTALVKALTGTDTDRLAEEKARGMTIDLGFAFLNDSITIIDVPGHEKFVRNMVAGVSTIHIALLVVAADDGIMPQTREHLHILKLLNIPQCVVAITKIDLVEDDEWLDLIELEINEITEGMFSNVDVVRTSATNDIGIAELYQLLLEKANVVKTTDALSFFRLQADRVFSMTGFGTVVTGTVISGELKKGNTLDVLPGNFQAKVRGIQSHGKEVSSVQKGDRAAVNLAGIDVSKITRGSELVAPGKLKAITRFTAHIHLIKDMKKDLKHGQRIRIHLGTGETMARVYLPANKKMAAASSGNVIFELEHPASIANEDRFVIRTYSPMTTIGGGTVLTTFFPKGVKINKWVLTLEKQFEKRFTQLVTAFKTNPKTIYEWSNLVQMTDNHIRQIVKQTGLKTSNHSMIFTEENLDKCKKIILTALTKFHGKNPLRKGMSADGLKQETGLSEEWLSELLTVMEKEGSVQSAGTGLALAGHEVELEGQSAELSGQLENVLMDNEYIPLKTDDLFKKLNTGEKEILEILHVLKNDEKVVEIERGIWMHNENMAKLRRPLIDHFTKHNSMSVGEFKKITKLTRKFAIPVLEYCDAMGWTDRDGNLRLKGENL